jgi:hypothetical protein
MGNDMTDNVEPKAVMTTDELARWNALPTHEQLARLRDAIQRGIESGPSDLTMQQVLDRVRARWSRLTPPSPFRP